MFKVSIAEVAVVTGIEGGHQAEERGLHGLADSVLGAKRAAVVAIARAKTQVWAEFRESMDKDF